MAFNRRTQGLRGLKQALGLGGGKTDVFAKHVHTIKGLFLPQRRQYLVNHHLQIAVGITFKFGRYGMGGQQRAAHFHRAALLQTRRHPQHFRFGFQVQAITRFDFNQAHALGQQAV